MEATALRGFLARNWLKVLLGMVFLFALLQKDLSFQLNLRAPAQSRKKMPVEQPVRKKEAEKFTDKLPAETKLSEAAPPKTDRFDLSAIGSDDHRPPAASQQLAKVSEKVKQKFLKRFTHVAVAERKKYGIPVAITLGNALLLSYAGERDLAGRANNFFALPCSPDWEGRKFSTAGHCYRRYENAWTSFRDHSLYLSSGSFKALSRLDPDDYEGWARQLERAGFGGEPDFASQLLGVIEAYRLFELEE